MMGDLFARAGRGFGPVFEYRLVLAVERCRLSD